MYNYFMNLISKIFLPHQAFAASNWNSKCVTNGDVATIQGLECVFQNAAQTIIYFAGIAFFIMFISGGFKWISSGGDPKRIAKASSALTLSIIGLVGVILSFMIIKFIGTFTGVNVTDFKIPK